MNKRWCVLASLVVCFGFAHATEIYRWVDDQGRTQVSDVVPEKYKAVAKRLDSRQFELSPQQRAEADARAARERRTANAAAAVDASRGKVGLAPAANLSAPSTGASGASARPAATDCASLQRAYAQSQECFAPFVTAKGAVKAEAYKTCTSLPDPSPKCGSPPSP